jgi:hypothetical protein
MMRTSGDADDDEARPLPVPSLLEEGMAGVGRVGPPGGRARWVRSGGRRGGCGRGGHPRLHVVPVVGEDETFEHLV